MKTKEEILIEATKKTLTIVIGSPLHDAVMKAMEEYVRERLIAFTDWHSSKYYEEIATEDEVDEFLKSTFIPKGDNFTDDDNYWK